MYTNPNFKTKKALKDAVARGDRVTLFSPGSIGEPKSSGWEDGVEGPHYPAPHTWYASVLMKDGVVVRVR